METGINFELEAHPTMRTSKVQVVDVGRVFVEFTDRDGATEIYDLDVGDYQGHRNFLSEDAGVDLPFFRSGKHDRLELTLYHDDTAPSATGEQECEGRRISELCFNQRWNGAADVYGEPRDTRTEYVFRFEF